MFVQPLDARVRGLLPDIPYNLGPLGRTPGDLRARRKLESVLRCGVERTAAGSILKGRFDPKNYSHNKEANIRSRSRPRC